MDNTVYLNGVPFPSPASEGGIEEKWELIWSANKGTTASGRTVGTVVAVKRVTTFTWPHLTPDMGKRLIEVLRNAVRSGKGFLSCRYFSAEEGAEVTIEGEMEAPSLSHLLTEDGLAFFDETSVTIREA